MYPSALFMGFDVEQSSLLTKPKVASSKITFEAYDRLILL